MTDRIAVIRAGRTGRVVEINGVAVVVRGNWTLPVACAWCPSDVPRTRVLGRWVDGRKPGSDRVSHSICPDCRAQQMKIIGGGEKWN